MKGSPGNYEIFLKKVDANSGSIAWRKRLTWTSADSRHPAVTAYNGYIYIAYQDGGEIFLKKVDANSGSIAWRKRLTWTSNAWGPAVTAYNGYIYVAYVDYSPGNAEIFLKKVNANSGSVVWRRRLTWTSYYSFKPTIAAYNGYIYIAYIDESSSNDDVFLKKVDASSGSVAWRKRISWGSQWGEHPSITICNGYIYVAYEYTSSSIADVFLKKVDANSGSIAWRRRLT